VPRGVLEAHGAVSEPVARALAHGARVRCGADLGLALTGIAGPGGGTAAKPVGLVHMALEDAARSLHWELRFAGAREAVRRRAVAAALDRLRRELPPET
jgi:PncC family amidohydrolase